MGARLSAQRNFGVHRAADDLQTAVAVTQERKNHMPAPRGKNQELIRELRQNRNSAAFMGLECAKVSATLTHKERQEIEQYVKESFFIWWDSWIAPKINEIEKKICAPKKVKSHEKI